MTLVQKKRPRRLRRTAALRRLTQETRPSSASLVMPLFLTHGKAKKEAIPSLAGQHRFSIDTLLFEAEALLGLGVRAVILFASAQKKTQDGREAWSSRGLTQQATRELKRRFPELVVITDTCLCAYTTHGHCGLVKGGRVANDPSIKLIAKTALSQAEAGADLVAPSDMMDGRVAAIRRTLDKAGLEDTGILSYAAKYASSFYGPFREAQGSHPVSGERSSYQMDPPNRREAMREIALDIEEGADIVMVKPALPCLDIIREASEKFSVPLAAYSVSGEYAMTKLMAKAGFADERRMALEMATAVFRSGADILVTYYTKELAKWLK